MEVPSCFWLCLPSSVARCGKVSYALVQLRQAAFTFECAVADQPLQVAEAIQMYLGPSKTKQIHVARANFVVVTVLCVQAILYLSLIHI